MSLDWRQRWGLDEAEETTSDLERIRRILDSSAAFLAVLTQ